MLMVMQMCAVVTVCLVLMAVVMVSCKTVITRIARVLMVMLTSGMFMTM